MKRIFVFLFIALGMFDAMAECVSVDSVTKCVSVENNITSGYLAIGEGGVADVNGDWHATVMNFPNSYGDLAGMPVSGWAEVVDDMFSPMGSTICHMDTPFIATSKRDCAGRVDCCADVGGFFRQFVVSSDGVCPDGFFIMPYDVKCGEGMVDIANVPNCSEDASGRSCLKSVGDPCDVISDCGAVSFTNDGNGKYALKYTACSGGICAKSETQVSACGNGYYGDGITCTRCPQNIMSDIPTYTDNGNGALIINANAREERDCYVTPEMKFSDLSGSYSYESNCSYTPGYVY